MLDQQPILPDSISILPLTDERWLALLNRNPDTNIFHHPAWSLLLAECYNLRPFVCAVCDTNGDVMAGLPVIEINSWITGRRWISLPFTDHCSPIFYNQIDLQYLTEYLVALSKDNKIEIELRADYPSHPEIHRLSNFVLHKIRLAPNELEVSNRIKSTHFQRIKVAEQRGVRMEWGYNRNHIREFYRLHLMTRQRKGIPVQPWKFFNLFFGNIIQKELGYVLLAYKDDECIAGAVFMNWNKTLVYKYSASIEKARQLHAMDLILWTAIKWGCKNGYEWMDMGRTDNEDDGLRAFKRRWGADETPLTYSYIPSISRVPSSGKLKAVMQSVIQKSPLWVCRIAGELLYRHFG
jgi:hypothetical protein